MKIGFSGTRKGLTTGQRDTLFHLLKQLFPFDLHHGDCVGADEEASAIYNTLRVSHPGERAALVIHPPEVESYRAFCDTIFEYDVIRPVKGYLPRNRDIVDETDALIACPDTETEYANPKSGTWYTVRYARSLGKKIYVIFPSGATQTQYARNSQSVSA